MSEERTKILEMVRDGVITIEEGEELLNVLNETKTAEKKGGQFKEKVKVDLHKTKEGLLRVKDRLVEEYEKISLDKVKERVKKGIDKIDKAVGKLDEKIINYGSKFIKKEKHEDDNDNEALDPTKDKNISFIDNDR